MMLGFQNSVKVLSLNAYIMGHVTYQDILEKTFKSSIVEVEFHSLHLTDYFKQDYLGRIVHWLLRKRLPGSARADYDFHRFRVELANSFFARRCLEHALLNTQPDILHIHTQGIALLSQPLLRQVPTVISLDTTTALLARLHPTPAHITYQPIIKLEQQCFDLAAHIITWSDWARQSVVKDYGIPPQKVSVIDPPIPLELFTSIIRNQGAELSKPRLLFVGNDFRRKGGEDLLTVFLEELAHSCELDIVTNAPLQLPDLPTLRLHQGLRPLSPELLALYQMADVFVMPTQEDVYGMVFAEAMAAGLPCVGTSISAIPELIQHGQNGFVIPPGDRLMLSQVLSQLIQTPELRRSMGMVGREMAQQKFDAIHNCQKMTQVWIDVLEMNKSA